MRIGAALPLTELGGGPLTGPALVDNARLLERLGYDSIWVFDAVGRGFIMPDALMALTVAATVTDSVELGTGVLQLPIRNTAETAYRVLTLHLLTGDRLLLGVGPGSTEVDFVTFDTGDFAERFQRFDEQLPEFRTWLETGAVGERTLTPWPAVIGGPAVYLAGWRGSLVERAAETDGWIASAAYADDTQLADAIGRFRQAGGKRAIVTNVQARDELGPVMDRLHHLAELGFDDAGVRDLVPTDERLAAILDGFRS